MTIHDTRREWLRRLALQYGNHADLARLSDLDPALLSRLIGSHPSKPVGDRLARRIECTLKLPIGYLDQSIYEADLSGKLATLPETQRRLIDKLLSRPIDDRCAAALTTLIDKL